MLDTQYSKHVTITPNRRSFDAVCAECEIGLPHAHVAFRNVQYTSCHVVSNTRRNFYHRVTVFENGWTSCSCESGQIQEARNEPAKCQLHLAQAHEAIASLYEAVSVTRVEAFDFDNAPLTDDSQTIYSDNCCLDTGTLTHTVCTCPCHIFTRAEVPVKVVRRKPELTDFFEK